MGLRLTILSTIILNIYCVSAQSFQYRTYFDDAQTQLKELITLRESDSAIHGLFTSYYQNGSLFAKGNYNNNYPEGLWTYYFENGNEKATGNLLRGNQEGEWTFFYENGELKSTGELKSGIKNGLWTNYYENGTRKSIGDYRSNKKHGIWNYYYEDGTSKAQANFDNGVGQYREFYPSGKIKSQGINDNDKSSGPWTFYFENGSQRSLGHYEGGYREGRWIFYHENGEIASEGIYRKGKRSGEWKFYHDNGQLSSKGSMDGDVKNGIWKLFYENGEVKSEANYDQGTGLITEYYPNGKVLANGLIENGVKSGKWVFFDENGSKDGEAIYSEGIGEYKGFYEDGKIKMTGQLENNKRIGEWSLYDREGNIVGKYRPIYEEERPIFKIHDVVDEAFVRNINAKPAYLYKNKSIRYFDEVINEYKGIIIATNPLRTALGEFPISLEYYVQERLGHELQVFYLRDPFFTSKQDLQLEQIYSEGLRIKLRQKFYSKDTEYGMLHFGHNLSFTRNVYNVDINDQSTNFQTSTFSVNEIIGAYGVFIGLRWLKNPGQSGFTIDSFIGLDVGLRNWDPKYEPSLDIDDLFEKVDQRKMYLPISFGINIGFMTSSRVIFKK